MSAESLDEQVALRAQGFDVGYPVWTMTHDNVTWPHSVPALPADLRSAAWADVSAAALYTTYEQAYRDQRLVEPHTPEALNQLIADTAFAPDLSTFAVSADGQIVGFVLARLTPRNEVELGPIGTDPAYRGRGISSALLAATLTRCRSTRQAPITLTVDAESATGAHRLYLRQGFRIARCLDVQHLCLPVGGA
ncbi:MAG TPA: GNAT family N-acetyltransferase [Kribbella sp.]|nr:GNAT family N-acetyltransferase [Kribbella sp.]